MKSSKSLLFFWMDDTTSGRSSSCKQIETFNPLKSISSTAKFIPVGGTENPTILFDKKVKEYGLPDLIVLDHFLNRKPSKTEGIPSMGSTVAEYIREKYKTIPIIAVTGAADMPEVEIYRDAYDDICNISHFRKYIPSLYSIAQGFRKLNSSRITCKADILPLLQSASEDSEKLTAILPNDLFSKDELIPQRLFRWLWVMLFKRPGLLYDKAWTANLLGIKQESFGIVEKQFKKAEYAGIFSVPSNPRWWPTKVAAILLEATKKETTLQPWERGHRLDNIKKQDYSRCFYCRGLFPEILGFKDDSRQRLVPLHLKHSTACITATKALFFEEDRKMQDE